MIITAGIIVLGITMIDNAPLGAIFCGVLAICHSYTLIHDLYW
jgi:hypothetical protein